MPLCSESTMRTMQEALQEAEKYASRCEALAALAVVGRDVLEQARAEQAERARAAAEAEEAAAAAAAEAAATAAAERLRMERQAAELTSRMQSDAILLQQVQAQLGVVAPAAPAPQPEAEGALCVVCMDAPKDHLIRPCMHMCTCEACTRQLLQQGAQSCPVCRGPIEGIERVFT